MCLFQTLQNVSCRLIYYVSEIAHLYNGPVLPLQATFNLSLRIAYSFPLLDSWPNMNSTVPKLIHYYAVANLVLNQMSHVKFLFKKLVPICDVSLHNS